MFVHKSPHSSGLLCYCLCMKTTHLVGGAVILIVLACIGWWQFGTEIQDYFDGPDRMDTLGVTFLKDSQGTESSYAIIEDQVYYISPQSREPYKIVGVDADTFEVIVYDSIADDGVLLFDYAKDAKRAYSVAAIRYSEKGYITEDVQHFEVLLTPEGEYSIYAKDGSQIYVLGLPMQADHGTFTVVSRDTARDSRNFFWEGEKRN